MTPEQREVIRELRDEGHAIVIFNPTELAGANQDHVEDRLVQLGWDVIYTLMAEKNEDEE